MNASVFCPYDGQIQISLLSVLVCSRDVLRITHTIEYNIITHKFTCFDIELFA